MPYVRTMLLAAAAALALPATASAADFYVDDNGPGPPTPSCQDAGHPCSTIAAALAKSRALAGTDTIHLAAGAYNEDVTLDQPTDEGLTLQGNGTLGAGATTISHASAAIAGVFLGTTVAPFTANITLKDLAVNVPVGSDHAKGGIDSQATHATLQDVTVTIADPGGVGTAIAVTTGNQADLRHVVVLSQAAGPGVFAAPGADVTLTDSGVAMASTSSDASGLVANNAGLRLSDSVVRLPAASAGYAVVENGGPGTTLDVDSSVIEGGISGVVMINGGGGSAVAHVRHSTIDVATAGVQDTLSGSSVWARTVGMGSPHATVAVTDSILVETPDTLQGQTGAASVTCDHTNVPPTLTPSIACGAAGGNTFADPAALFVDGATQNYALRSTSPAIDAGTPGALPADEITTDRNGSPRDVDGDYDCVARPDQGAYEVQGQGNTAPTVTGSGPASGAFATALAFSAVGADAEDAPSALSYAWTFSDAGHATGATTQHAFGASGSQSATVTVSDSHGCTATSEVPVTIAAAPGSGTATTTTAPAGTGTTRPPTATAAAGDRTAPVLRAASLKPATLRLARSRKLPAGSTLRFTLSEAATITATYARSTCKKVRKRRVCTAKPAGSAKVVAAKAGAGTAKLTGRVGTRKLAPGAYTLTLVARDAAGNASKPRTLKLTIVR